MAAARAQPSGQGLGAAVGQQVPHAPGLQIDEDRAVGAPALERPVIDAQRGWGETGRQRSLPHQSQKRVGTGWHRQGRQQPCTRFAAESNRYRALRRCQSAGAPRVGGDQARQPLAEGAARAGRVVATKTAHVQSNLHGSSQQGQVAWQTLVAAVACLAPNPASRTTRSAAHALRVQVQT